MFQTQKLQKTQHTFVIMAITRINIEEFLILSKDHPVLDVRSPGEYSHAHIPGAISLPLFSDEERKIVGTAYKQESKEKAVKLGLNFFGVKMVKMVEEVCKIRDEKYEVRSEVKMVEHDSNVVLVHCWRGGMRSAGVAWLLDLYGFKVFTLVGGYKVYRKWVLQQFEKQYSFHILGGYTGSGKTEILEALDKKNELVIDLEKLASHKGSAFGRLGQPIQPSQEMFENLLANALKITEERQEKQIDFLSKTKCIWLEDESQRIGEVNIPNSLFSQMRDKPIYFLDIPFEERLDFIVAHYGKFDKIELVNSIIRIKKRLGGLETKTAINHLIEDNVKEGFAVLLAYYDKSYGKSLQNRTNLPSLLNKIICLKVDDEKNANTLLELLVKSKTSLS